MLGTATLTNGKATFQHAALTIGKHVIAATYSGAPTSPQAAQRSPSSSTRRSARNSAPTPSWRTRRNCRRSPGLPTGASS